MSTVIPANSLDNSAIPCTCVMRGEVLEISSGRPGKQPLRIDTRKVDRVQNMPTKESALYQNILSEEPFNGRPWTVQLSREEMNLIVNVRNRSENAPAIPATTPAPVAVDSLPAPAPVVNTTPIPAPVPVAPVVPAPEPTPVPLPPPVEHTSKDKTAETIVNGVSRRMWGSGTTEAEQRISQANNLVRTMTNERYNLLVYDIETVKNSECPNPSKKFRKLGFRLNLSCWVIPDSRINHQDVTDFLALCETLDIETHVVPQDPAQQEKYKAIARKRLEKAIAEYHSSLVSSITGIAAALKKVVDDVQATPNDREKAEKYHDNRLRTTIREAMNRLKDACECASLFEQTSSVQDLLAAFRNAVESERQAFNAMARVKAIKQIR